jgi:hypothetical protein
LILIRPRYAAKSSDRRTAPSAASSSNPLFQPVHLGVVQPGLLWDFAARRGGRWSSAIAAASSRSSGATASAAASREARVDHSLRDLLAFTCPAICCFVF